MKKSKLLILFPVMGLFLSGCTFQEGLQSTKSWINSHIYQPLKSFFSSSSTPAPSEEGKKEEEKKDEGKTFSFADLEKYYADEGFSGVKIPEYKCASSSATMSVFDAEDYPNYMLIKGSNATEMATFIGSFSTTDWEKYESNGQTYFAFGGFPEPGESAPLVSIADYSSNAQVGGIIVAFDIYEEPAVVAEFPREQVNTFLTDNEFGFSFAESASTEFLALSNSFSVVEDTYNGYPILYLYVNAAGVFDGVDAIIAPLVAGAGYELDSDASEEGYKVYSDGYCGVYVEDCTTYTSVTFY